MPIGIPSTGGGAPASLFNSTVPIGLGSSGTVGLNGALTLNTSFLSTYNKPGLFLFFPAGAVYAGSLAGFYWCVMANGTQGTIYNNNSSSLGPLTVPVILNNIIDAGPGAYVQSTANLQALSYIIPTGTLGLYSGLAFDYSAHSSGDLNTKSIQHKINNVQISIYSNATPTTLGVEEKIHLSNRGVLNAPYVFNISAASRGGFVTTTGIPITPNGIDFSGDQTVTIMLQIPGASTSFNILQRSTISLLQ